MQWRRRLHAATNVVARAWSGVLVALLALAVVVAAFIYPGKPNADLHLHDDMLYVVNGDAELLGQVNGQINDLAASTPVFDRTVQVLQSGTTVLAWNQASNQLLSYDPAAQQLGAPVNLPENAGVAMDHGNLVVINRASGKGWNGPVEKILATDLKNSSAQFDLQGAASVVMTTGGTAVALVPSRSEIVHIDTAGKKRVTKLPFVLGFDQGKVQLSAVGDKAVVLDGNNGQFWMEGDSHASQLPGGNDAVLAHPAAKGLTLDGRNVRAVVETAAGLVGSTRQDEFVLLQAGEPGTRIAPLVNGDCAYGVSGPAVQIACAGRHSRSVAIPEYRASQELELRANREVVGLNESATGRVWMINAGMKLITDWTRVMPPKAKEAEKQQSDETQRINPDRTKPNRPPVAKPDELTVRAGRATMLPVLDNDYDPDGDILTVSELTRPTLGSLATVRGGTQVQFDAPADAAGKTTTAQYTIDDGRGGTAKADVTIHIVSADQKVVNTAPVQVKQEPRVIAQNSQLSVRALLDWKDPEGDDLVVVGAQMADGDDIVTFTPDGVLSYTDVGKTTGQKTIKVTVSDGLATTEGSVVVDVRKAGQIPPVANGDYYETEVGADLLAKPLENDQGSNLLLSFVNRNLPGATVTPNFDAGTFNFTAQKPGTYYVDYVVSSGPTAYGLVRIDVKAPDAQNRPPIAVRDVALLPMGGSVLVDPLLNDEDPDGDVLVLQSVSADPHLQIEMSERHLLTIRAITTPSAPISLTYNVSDGLHSVAGTIVVIPSPLGADTKPIAVSDDVTVRAGTTATVSVLTNDYSPVGSTLKLDPQLVGKPDGFSWVDGDTLRYTAPTQPGHYQAIYQVHDDLGQVGSALVRFTVVAADAENRPPAPLPITGRVLAGTKTRIPIRTEGIDPNGDAVRLLGLDSGPRLGRITSVGDHWLEYEAYPGSTGSDSFTYAVTDAQGLKGVGTIRVGVVPPTSANNAPTAIDDKLTVRPNKTVRIPVLANDYDQDGDRFGFAKDALRFPVPAKLVGDSEVEISVGDTTVQGSYTVEDARGGRASANVVITVDPKAAPLPPLARDDTVDPAQVAGQDVIDVPVLANDVDPDGDLADAQLSVPPYPCAPEQCATVPQVKAGAPAAEHVVRVHVGSTMQQIRYEVKDADGLVASALIIVPGNADATPALRGNGPELEVVAGEPLEIDIAQYVIGTKNQKVSLTADDRVWASSGQGQAVNNHTVRFTAQATYQGPAAIVFEVTDGRNSADPAGKKAVLSLPIKVKPRPTANRPGANGQLLDQPPTSPPVTLQVGAGEPERSINLADSASDPDGDALTFSEPQGGGADGVSVRWDGLHTLSASAALTTAPGTRFTLHGTVSDGRGASAPTQIDVVVVPTSAPRASVADDLYPNANQGQPVTVSPLLNDTSPWPDKPLSIVAAVTESGAGSTPQVNGDQVTVTPDANFVGTLVVRYTVADATKSPDRYVDGRIRITVRGRPSQPQTPRTADTSDINHKVTLTWPAANDNGAPIQKYTVVAHGKDGSSLSQDCPTTTCTVTGLTNGVAYTFTVSATNEVGRSLESPPSAEITPDQRPPAPGAPNGQFGDRAADVTWSAPSYDGTPVVSYDIETQSADVNLQKTGLTATTYHAAPLTNGTSYTFRVRAINQSGMVSEWSAWSASVVPAGVPGKPADVRATDTPERTGGKVVLTWSPADPNGDAPTSYTVTVRDPSDAVQGAPIVLRTGTSDIQPVPGSSALQAVLPSPNGSFTYSVAATNKAGTGAEGRSPLATVFGAPDTPDQPGLTPGDGRLHLSINAPRTHGAPINGYRLTVWTNGSQQQMDLPAQGSFNGDLTAINGVPVRNAAVYSVAVAACAQASGGAPKCSDASTPSAQVVPFGPPGAVGLDYDIDPQSHWSLGSRTESVTVFVRPPDGNTTVPPGFRGPYSNGTPIELWSDGTDQGRGPYYRPGRAGIGDRVIAWAAGRDGYPDGPVSQVQIDDPFKVTTSTKSKVSFTVAKLPAGQTYTCGLTHGAHLPDDATVKITPDGNRNASGDFTTGEDKPFGGIYVIHCAAPGIDGAYVTTITV